MKPNQILRLLVAFLSILIASACGHEKPQCIDPWATSGVDEAAFRSAHHYWKNDNFVTSDSIFLQSCIPGEVASIYTRDSAFFEPGDEIVVANVSIVPADSVDTVWVMAARDQVTMGWVHETEFLEKTVPDNPVSRFISGFSDSRIIVLITILCIAFLLFLVQRFRKQRIQIVHINDIPSFYPTLLCLTVSISAAIYGTLQNYYPEEWAEFYFHPTFNPFGQTHLLTVFLVSVWAILIVLIAVVDDVRKQPNIVGAASYMASLLGVCMVLYFVFTIIVHYRAGYVLLLVYWIFALRQHWVNNHASYRCGHCGCAMRDRGVCPHCGAINE